MNGRKHNWDYLGQERQEELGLNWLTFRYRNYNPEIGRFFGVDPVSSEYMSISTFQFAHNNPVWKVEIEGLEGESTNKKDLTTHEPVKVQQARGPGPIGPIIASGASNKVVEETTKQVAKKTIGKRLLTGAAKLAGAVARSAGNVIAAFLMPQQAHAPGSQNSITTQKGAQPDLKPINAFDTDNSVTNDDDGVTLYRGVPRLIPTSHTGETNPAYIPATAGTAVPQGGTDDPVAANKGVPSNFTFWTTDEDIAEDFATNGDESDGIVLTKKFPKEVLESNGSPDRYQEGEIQIRGTVYGATPITVFPKQ